MKIVNKVVVQVMWVVCPECSENVEGWMGDPRGEITTCDSCGTEFIIAEDADIELY